MKNSGTSKYLQNIGEFIDLAERRYKNGEHPGLSRPDAVFFNLKRIQIYFINIQRKHLMLFI